MEIELSSVLFILKLPCSFSVYVYACVHLNGNSQTQTNIHACNEQIVSCISGSTLLCSFVHSLQNGLHFTLNVSKFNSIFIGLMISSALWSYVWLFEGWWSHTRNINTRVQHSTHNALDTSFMIQANWNCILLLVFFPIIYAGFLQYSNPTSARFIRFFFTTDFIL